MLVFKKIVAAIFMILSIIAITVLIIVLFGSWAVRSRLETITVNLLFAGENVVETTRDGLARMDEVLENSHTMVTEVDSAVKDLETDILESDPLFVEILNSIGVDLKSGIENTVVIFNQLEANIAAVNDAVDAIRAIPFLDMDSRLPTETKLQQIEERMAQVRQDVTDLTQEVEDNRTEIVEGKIGEVTAITSRLIDDLRSLRSDMEEADARLAESAQSMTELRERIPRIYSAITILVDLLILLIILAFISLFLHALEYFRCTERGLSGLMPGECAKAPAVS